MMRQFGLSLEHGRCIEALQTLRELRVTERHRLREVLLGDRLRNFAGLQWHMLDSVTANM